MSSSDATDILSYLAGKIGQTQLGSDVLDPIKEIPGLRQEVSDNSAAITSEQKQRQDADAALSTRVDKVSAQINVPMAGDTGGMAGSTSVYAGVWSEQSARAEADLALSKRVDTVTAQFDNANSKALAAVRTETEARTTAQAAQAQQITTIQAQVNDTSAAVQTVAKSYADLNGQLSASYTVKTQITRDGRTYMAGISLGVNDSGGDVESQILMSASRFAIIDPNGSAISSPFIVQGGQVFLSDAFIGNGRITNAMIGNYIQSDNFVAGRSGWRLDKSGWFEINNTDGQGNRLNIDSNGLRGFDANGTLRYRLGFF